MDSVTRRASPDSAMAGRPENAGEVRSDSRTAGFLYVPLEPFGQGLTTGGSWNFAALAGVERLNGRLAMLGFAAALAGEALTGRGVMGQLMLMLRWLLG
jgi:hypothetical protein